MATKFISLENLTSYTSQLLTRLKTLFVQRELKTGSTDTYKVLSDNNLTDALVKKINDAGSSSFNGAYDALTGKPSIGGKEIASGDQTAASLGLATPTDVTTAANAARSGAVDDVKKLGYQTADQVGASVDAAKTELQNKLGSAFKPKGSSLFADLPTSGREIGDVWNITDAFTTTDGFVEGAGVQYPSGSNVVLVNTDDGPKWDVLSGVTDLSAYATKDSLGAYLLKTDMVAAADAEIDALFTTASNV
ncbi:hypothetical protein [Bifidobacterium tissieri]|uniref:Uncharacterized protein n=1 Tax=Bifidobacterium tissieri TaxID=1630162 RepID=A0A5M9ZXT2_9BIFI|nr:hypothetical protein [Bifidobacterium tissieri]KAA8829349.1 hypothetical protein EM849_11125 [Bifidobacterium tissieri]KAA8831662.1 hypothetical protein EMO89_02765 [Bifidobacterium tissieri]